jgi:hypothetical protein
MIPIGPSARRPPGGGSFKDVSRRAIAIVLTLLGCLLAGPAVAAFALDHQITEQDRYVDAVTPVADDPLVRRELAERISDVISEKLGPGSLQLPATARQAIGIAVSKVVESDGFRTAWAAINRAAQPEVVAMLRGQPSSLRIEDNMVVLDAGMVMDQVKARLTADGVSVARFLPDIDVSVRVFSRPAIRRAIPAFDAFEKLSLALPIASLILIVAGLVVSRGRTLLLTGLGVAVSILLVVVYQWIAHDQLIASSQTPILAGEFYDALTGYLTVLLWVVFGIGILAAIAGLLRRLLRQPRVPQG